MDPYIGEIQQCAWNFAPYGFALCNGQTLPVREYPALFALIGNVYGGDGSTTFCLPDLRGRVPVGINQAMPRGKQSGTETVALDSFPAHDHGLVGSQDLANQKLPGNPALAVFGKESGSPASFYAPAGALQQLAPATLATTGASVGHNNMQPFVVINYCIALTGVWPPRD